MIILIGLVSGTSLAYTVSQHRAITVPPPTIPGIPAAFSVAGTVKSIDYDRGMILVDAVSPYGDTDPLVFWVILDQQTNVNVYVSQEGKHALTAALSDIGLYPGSYVSLWIDSRGGFLRAQTIAIEPNV